MDDCEHHLSGGDLMAICTKCRRWFEGFLKWNPTAGSWFAAWRPLRTPEV